MKLTKVAIKSLNDLNHDHAVVMVGGKCLIMNLETVHQNSLLSAFHQNKILGSDMRII